MAAPDILLAADVAALEHVEIMPETREEHCNLQFAQRSQKAIILNFTRQVCSHIRPEIILELKALRVLVVHRSAGHSALIGTAFVRQGNAIAATRKCRCQKAIECQHSAERRMAVQSALAVELKQQRMDRTLDNNHIVKLIPGTAHALNRSATRVHNQRQWTAILVRTKLSTLRSVLAAKQFQRHHRVLASAYRDNMTLGDSIRSLKQTVVDWLERHLRLRHNSHKIILRGSDSVGVEELAQAVKEQLFPECHLAVRQFERLDRHLRRTVTLPVADQLNHTYVEHQAVERLFRQPVGVQERPRRDEGRGAEHKSAVRNALAGCRHHPETKRDVHTVRLHIIFIAIVDEHGEHSTIGVI